jgi:hypothetical protein
MIIDHLRVGLTVIVTDFKVRRGSNGLGSLDPPSELLEEDVDVEAALPVQQVDLAPLLPPLVPLSLLKSARRT